MGSIGKFRARSVCNLEGTFFPNRRAVLPRVRAYLPQGRGLFGTRVVAKFPCLSAAPVRQLSMCVHWRNADWPERIGSCTTMTVTTTRRKHAEKTYCCASSCSSGRSSRASRGIERAPTNSRRSAVSGSTRSGSSVVNRRRSSGGRRRCASESASPRSAMSGATATALPRTRTASPRLRQRSRIPWPPSRPARCGCGLEAPWSISRPSSGCC